MEFRYGKQDWKTFERGEENCCLMTNGLGSFSSLSMTGSCSRGDQAVLMACLKSPNHRYNMIHRLQENLCRGGEDFCLSSQDFAERERREEGFRYQQGFTFEDHPVWTYLVKGVEVTRRIALAQGENTVGIRYEIENGSKEKVVLNVTPYLEFVPKGSLMPAGKKFSFRQQDDGASERTAVISSEGISLHLRTNGTLREIPLQICEGLYYAADEKDGRQAWGRAAANHVIDMEVPAGGSAMLELVYSTAPVKLHAEEIEEQLRRHRAALRERAGFAGDVASALAVAADQFLSYRESTDGWTILAGFPFFEDWGRDTMIALTGCCLVTGQFEKAKSIFRTFASCCWRGLLPNLFPEGTEKPGYNTVDASLLFILAVREYFQRTDDKAFVREMLPVMEDIIRWYAQGTDYGIRMDRDGLLTAGSGLDQVTWMDVRIGNILPTPRHGKPVEINAYWYNALRAMERFEAMEEIAAPGAGPAARGKGLSYGEMADRVKACFEEKFWNEENKCLKDVLCDGPEEDQIRCNQIWAVSLPESLLSPKRERQMVQTVYEKLYTPLGLRTLDPADAEYHGFYGGPQKDRDMAYHQGTVWTFPLGGFYLAYLKVNHYSEESRRSVAQGLRLLAPSLREGCIGQLAEIFDGDNPSVSKGCYAQAWSVGEILRVYEALGKDYV